MRAGAAGQVADLVDRQPGWARITVAPAATAEAEVAQSSLSDTAIGITAQALPFIFEPFVQDVQAVGFNGAGLGAA